MIAIITVLLLFNVIWASAQITYTRQDSIKVVCLLKEGMSYHKINPDGKSLMLFYGHKLEGIPYVAHTLEVNKTEKLIVNLRQLDCTTFTETVLALARTTVKGSIRWSDYCNNLRLIRYECGKMDGYPSRNHYFIWWVESNRKLGVIETPMDDDAIKNKSNALYKHQTIHIDWMTKHSDSYSMLKGNKNFINKIGKHERQTSGKMMMYIPQTNLGLSQPNMRWVENGDILAICTNKKGLDTTHIGIAEWGSDGKLHLLNASQIHKKVILEPMSLQKYMKQHPVQIGIWVIKPVL